MEDSYMPSNKFRYVSGVLSFVAVFAIVHASVSAQCVAPPSGMVHWWTADDNTFDIVGGEHGLLQNGATYDDGKVIRAFSLDGVNDYVEVPHDPTAAFNFQPQIPGGSRSFTVDAWINLETTPPDFAPILSKWNDIGVNQRNYFLAVENHFVFPNPVGPLVVRFDVSANGFFLGGNSSRYRSTEQIPLNTWTHLAGVFDGTAHTLTVYINGVPATPDPASLVQSANVSAPFLNSEPVLIGAGDLGSNLRDFFDGRIDEVELFDRALTQAEVFSIYNAGTAGKIATISIDVKPGNGDDVDPINLKSKGKTPVAVLSTETFDATTMDIGSIRFAGAAVNVKNNGMPQFSFEDVNADGLLDLVLHFNTQDLNLTDSSTEAILTGTTDNGRCVSAADSIKIVPSN